MDSHIADEFALLPENAAELGLELPSRPSARRVRTDHDEGHVSAIKWGDESPRAVFLHGGAQNAHTWDSVVLALGVPALAVDLPGHGHSSWRDDGDYSPWPNADAVAAAVREWASEADVVVGMSLGGLTAIRLAAVAPELVRRMVLVDVTPASIQRHQAMTQDQRGTVALASGPAVFDTFDEIVALTTAAAPHRSASSIRRGVIHNTRKRADGRWEWRYDRMRVLRDFTLLWDELDRIDVPVTLVRGGASAFVTEEDVDEARRRVADLKVHVVPGSGHSVQSDAPLELTETLRASL
ncbi:alpha/beta fold hydrolase [Rhodococcus artemisiae]|uniref:Alpha/beta hydrolase n=1 Tax=Rhodococcus artemisiae TaxID=714159 RepID=A0ABU7L740_9NOCA|nr:alpha/beta hydrolase [Rhodococcus artemisiae]MEE2057353.1 alpha/beta hydrolase [Rhodococcus artemisiae]